MKIYGKEDAIKQMNEWGRRGEPFLFVIDYEEENIVLSRMDDINPTECLFAFPQASNGGTAVPPLPEEVLWHITPPAFETYEHSFDIVHRHLMRGDSFLCNLTCRIPIFTNLSTQRIFLLSKAPYKLWLRGRCVCFSPEIFVRIEGGKIRSFPMKGTIDATLPRAEEMLLADAKETAEHATIVDLIRNDLSMVSEHVHVERYRYIDRIMTNKGAILQTSSIVTGTLPDDYTAQLGKLLFRLLPAGSITGAPKKKTCEIIRSAEGEVRGYYTGVMGYFDGRDLDSAVMIRFIEEDAAGELFFHAGGGITARSNAPDEYNEVIQKTYVPIY